MASLGSFHQACMHITSSAHCSLPHSTKSIRHKLYQLSCSWKRLYLRLCITLRSSTCFHYFILEFFTPPPILHKLVFIYLTTAAESITSIAFCQVIDPLNFFQRSGFIVVLPCRGTAAPRSANSS